MKEGSIQKRIMDYLLNHGESSKGRIEKQMQTEYGTLGDTTGRTLRLMTEAGLVIKGKKEYLGKWYTTYAVKPIANVELPQPKEVNEIHENHQGTTNKNQ